MGIYSQVTMTAKNLRRLNGRCLQHRRNDQKMRKCGIVVRKLLRRLTLPEWHRVLDTNLTAAFLLARAAEKPARSPWCDRNRRLDARTNVGAQH